MRQKFRYDLPPEHTLNFDSTASSPTAIEDKPSPFAPVATSFRPHGALRPQQEPLSNTQNEVRHDPGRPFATLLGDQDPGLWDDVSIDTSTNGDYFDLDIDSYYANGNNSCGFIPGVPAILSDENELEPDDLAGAMHAVPARGSTHARQGSFTSDVIDSQRQETAGLLKHFVEIMGPMMDVLDLDAYFTRVLPLRASRSAMIRSALAAVASKKIAQDVGSSNQLAPTRIPATSSSAKGPHAARSSDWFYKAAGQYDKSLGHLRYALQHWSKRASAEPSDISLRHVLSPDSVLDNPKRRRLLEAKPSFDTEFEDILSAISVLNLYENLETSGAASQHANGFRSLLNDATRTVDLQARGDALAVFASRRGGRAAFWNFALEDIASAYAHQSSTTLDSNDTELFRAAGLDLDDASSIADAPLTTDQALSTRSAPQREDTVAYTLIWLTMRAINLVAAQQRMQATSTLNTPGSPATVPDSETDSSVVVSEWQQLHDSIDHWYLNLPMTFHPYASVPQGAHHEDESTEFSRILYSMPVSATALQLYHFVKILLILNRPLAIQTNPAKRLRAYRQASEESMFHARHICGIALGSPPASVQRHMLQPLHLAGLCFEADSDRKVVLDLLRSIEASVGCSTNHIIARLASEWG